MFCLRVYFINDIHRTPHSICTLIHIRSLALIRKWNVPRWNIGIAKKAIVSNAYNFLWAKNLVFTLVILRYSIQWNLNTWTTIFKIANRKDILVATTLTASKNVIIFNRIKKKKLLINAIKYMHAMTMALARAW